MYHCLVTNPKTKHKTQLYPPAPIHRLLCSILRHMRSKNPSCLNFLDKKDCRFKQLHGTLDAYFHKLHSQGVGRQTNHANILTSEDEDRLWSTGVLSVYEYSQLSLLSIKCFVYLVDKSIEDCSEVS